MYTLTSAFVGCCKVAALVHSSIFLQIINPLFFNKPSKVYSPHHCYDLNNVLGVKLQTVHAWIIKNNALLNKSI